MKNERLESLCRALQTERSDLNKQLKVLERLRSAFTVDGSDVTKRYEFNLDFIDFGTLVDSSVVDG